MGFSKNASKTPREVCALLNKRRRRRRRRKKEYLNFLSFPAHKTETLQAKIDTGAGRQVNFAVDIFYDRRTYVEQFYPTISNTTYTTFLSILSLKYIVVSISMCIRNGGRRKRIW
jgi:hypothetical protein